MKQVNKDKAPKRYIVIFVLMCLIGIYILGKALYTMLPPESDYWKEVGRNSKTATIPASRGNILSCDRQVLSGTVPKYALYMDFAVSDPDSLSKAKTIAFRETAFRANLDSMAKGLARIFPDYDADWFRKRLLKGKQRGKYSWRIYPKLASYVQYRACKELPFLRESMYRSGFHADEMLLRLKPYGGLASRTIGELYNDTTSLPKCGLELSFDSILRGKPGKKHYTIVRNRRVPIIDVPVENGHDLLTTIDINIQDFADRTLRSKMKEKDVNGEIGVVVVMEVKTGDVKAIVNLTRGADGEYYEMKNNAVSDLWEPGSTFKTASIMIALEDGKIDVNKVVDCAPGIVKMHGRNMKDHNWHKGGYKELKVEDILGQSSNIGVSKIIDEAYGGNPSAYVDGLHRIGVGIPLNLPFVGRGEPYVPHPKNKERYWSKPDLPWMSIGYVTMLPPISTLTFYNAIANGGKMVRPRFVKAELKDGMVLREFPTEVIKERICKPSTLRDIQYCLEHVVSGGLGKKAGNGGKLFKVSGKTGTAQFSENGSYASRKYMVSFCGYFPSDEPKYSCIVCIKKQGLPASGGGQCGPVFSEISQYIMSRDSMRSAVAAADTSSVFVPAVTRGSRERAEAIVDGMGLSDKRLDIVETDTVSLDKVPDVTGMGVKDAVYVLQQRGLRVRVNGCGQIVKQDLPAGTVAVRGRKITLTASAEKL
ncbi:MAG: transpeptidase family protein [Bacteroidaceae bacterium]|nr:transpeptidase family protein [Bacteroidaceae bacterium]